jgi:hypothetical protein
MTKQSPATMTAAGRFLLAYVSVTYAAQNYFGIFKPWAVSW